MSNDGFYNIALIDIILPDMDGTQLLTGLRETKPRMRKIIITGHASLQNAVEALNKGADSYIMKPLDPEEIFHFIEENLKKQREETEMTQERIWKYIESQAEKLEQEMLEEEKEEEEKTSKR